MIQGEPMKVKMCGITQMPEVEIINEIKPDFVGMVMFFPKSKRNVTPEQATVLLAAVSGKVKRVAVVVSPTAKQLEEIEKLGFDLVQIHGEISDELIEGCHIPVWKAFNVRDMDMYPHYQTVENIEGYVFDAGEPGSGRTFDWDSLKDVDRDGRLFVLAGGLTPENVGRAIEVVKPDAVDVSSGIEAGTAGKSPEKMRSFAKAAYRTI